MPPPPRRHASRILLWSWAILSLFLVAYAGLLFLQTVPVTPAAADAMTVGDARPLAPGDRVLLESVNAPGDVRTALDANGTLTALGAAGDVLYRADDAGPSLPSRLLPVPASGGSLTRALAYVARNATTGGWDVPGLGARNVTNLTIPAVFGPGPNGTMARTNLTVNLASVNGTAGFIVKPDAADAAEPDLLPLDRVQGRVDRVITAGSLWFSLILSSVGFLVPLALIIASHRGRGVSGVPGAGGPACPECGRTVDQPSLGFCPRCGASLRS